MRIAICEDNELHRDILEHLLGRYFAERSIPYTSVAYPCGRGFLCDMEEGAYYDAAFLDIYMEDAMGNEIAHRLRAMGYRGEIVFLTASPDFAVESYDVDAGGYLLKPLDYEKLVKVLNRITRHMESAVYRIRRRSTVIRIAYDDILYVESSNSKCLLHTAHSGDYTVYKKLDTIEEELANRRFLRCHQSFLVNMDHVRALEKQFVLTSGACVPIRQRGIKSVRLAYMDYLAARSAET